MTARRPKVPRAGRPLPSTEGGPAVGDREGFDAARTPHPAPKGAAAVRSGGTPRKPSVPRGVGPSATKDPRANGMSTTQHAVASSVHGGSHLARGAQGRATGSDAQSGTTGVGHGRAASGVPAREGAPRPTSDVAKRSARQGTTSRAAKPTSPSQARAAERSELAGSIRRGRLGSRRAESVIQPAEEATPIPAKSFSGRLLALAFVVVVVIVLLAPSVSRYFQQQAELDALRADIALQQDLQADYRSELARWDDPAFVKQQARERIFLVMPGETRYLVKGGTGIEEGTGEGSSTDPGELPWVDALWDSVERAATD